MYSITSLRSPSRVSRAAGVRSVFNPPRTQGYAPSQAPLSYEQQLGQLQSSNVAPNFLASSAAGPMSADSGGAFGGGGAGGGSAPPTAFSFSNAGNPAFNQHAPSFGGSANFNGISVDYGSDPILQQAQAFYESQMAQARASAIGAERQALIRYGNPDLVAQVLGNDATPEVTDAARNNSFGTVQELGRWNGRALSGIDTATNRNNLYFSSARERDRGLQQEDYVRQSARTANQLQDLLTGVAQNLLSQGQSAQQGLMAAGESAYGRALSAAMAQAQLAAMMAGMNNNNNGIPSANAPQPDSGWLVPSGVGNSQYYVSPSSGTGGDLSWLYPHV